MDVTKPDGHSDAVKFASGCTGTSVTATNGIDPAGLGGNGKKKAKKKNKAKNSSSGEVIEMAAKESRDVVNTRALTNGTPETIAIDAISRQFEQCVQLNRNGLTNGAPVAPPRDIVNGSTGPSGNGSSGGGGGKKNKQRNKQAKSGTKVQNPDEVAVCGVDKSTQETANRINNNTLELITDGGLPVAEQPTEQRKDRDPGDGDDGDCGSSTPSTISTSLSSSPGSVTSECKVKQQQSSLPNLPSADGDGTSTLVPSQELKLAPDPDLVPPAAQIDYKVYESERQMPFIMALIQKDLSEPYSIYTYRYFIHNWPKLCFLALHGDECVGAIVCKLDFHRQNIRRGYIAMLAVDKEYRKMKIGTTLVKKAIQAMLEYNADEVVLETEITNQPALRLYENLGFVRDKRLFHYYLNGVDALRLKLWFT